MLNAVRGATPTHLGQEMILDEPGARFGHELKLLELLGDALRTPKGQHWQAEFGQRLFIYRSQILLRARVFAV